MASNDFEIVFSAKDEVSPAVNSLLGALGKLNTSLPQADKSLTKFEQSLANAATKAGLLGTAVAGTTAPMSKAQQALANYNKTIAEFEARGARTNAAGRMVGANGRFISATDVAAYEKALRGANAIEAQIQSQRAARASQHNQQQLAAIRNNQAVATSTKGVATAAQTAAKSAQELGNVFVDVPPNSVRYALYDVSQSLAILGAALSAGAVAAIGFAASYERAFADVQRTVNDLSPAGITQLHDELIELASTIPVTFQELSRIASLGGQLGITGSGIDEFTESVAKLATVSDLTVDKAATAFGRFKAILGVPEQEFDNLASSILAVGVNSVATESQIVNITTQIASMAGFAGFTADQVVGLSGALASIGAPPELSRGVVTRLFATMSEAVSESSLSLDRFAQIAGVSAAEFEAAWGTEKFAGVFQKFMRGLANEGGNAVVALHELGITSVRDVPLLMRLAGAADSTGKKFGLLTQTLNDAKKGWEENKELTRQYDIIAGTFIERLKVLGNNFANLAATVGGPLLAALKPALDALIGFVGFLQDLAATPVGSVLFATAAALLGITGAALLLGSAGARAVGGIIAMQQATNGLLGSVTATRIQLGVLNAQVATTPGVFGKAAAAATGLGRAFSAAFGPVGIAIATLTLIPGAVSMARDAIADMTDTTRNSREQINSFKDDSNAAFVQGLTGFSAGIARFSTDLGVSVYSAADTLKSLDQTIAELATSGKSQEAVRMYNDLAASWKSGGGDIDALNGFMKDAIPALEGVAGAADVTTGEFLELSDAEEASIKTLEALQKTLADGALSFINTGDLIKANQDQQIQAAKDVAIANGASAEEAETAWKEYYDGQKINLTGYLDGLQQQVDAQTNWKKNLETLGERGVSQEILADLAKLGPEGIPLVQALVDGSAEELQRYKDLWAQAGRDSAEQYAVGLVSTQFILENAMKNLGKGSQAQFLQALNSGMPLQSALKQWDLDAAGNPIDIKANAAPAYDTAAQYLRWVRQQSAAMTISVDIAVRSNALAGLTDQSGRPINVGQFAEGGYTGPGGKYQAAGVVHRGEFVFPQEDVRRIGLSNLYAMMGNSRNAKSGGRGYANGGAVTSKSGVQIVELSAYDRYLLKKIGVDVTIGNDTVAAAANDSTTNSNRRGKM